MLFLLLAACLIHDDVYQENLDRLTDLDDDGYTSADHGGDDCDDDDASVFPGATEHCNGIDDDCNGDIDEDATDSLTWYRDADTDGFGDPTDSTTACVAPNGFTADHTDCDDSNDAVHPDAAEVPYDGLDNDCADGDLVDIDGDGWDAEEADGDDCNDSDAEVHPGATETWDNGATDNDCDGDYGAATLEYGAEAWTGEAAGDNAGRRLAALGDITGDGMAEFLVAAPFQSRDYDYAGAVYVVSGGEPGPLGEEGVIRGGGEYWSLGIMLSSSARSDDDSAASVLIGASGVDDGAGAAWLVSASSLPGPGESYDIDDAASWVVYGEESNSYAGGGGAHVGDIDGDGLEDVAVAANFADVGGFVDSGVVSVFTGGDEAVTMSDGDVVVSGFFDGHYLGSVVEAAGDQDGDGYADYMLAGTGVVAAIAPGGVAELNWETDFISLITATDGVTRADAHMVGDIDGDGQEDLSVIIDSADVHLFTTLAGNPSRTVNSYTTRVSFGGEEVYVFDVTDLGDLDGDGRADTYIQPQSALKGDKNWSSVLFGNEVETGRTISYSTLGLRTISTREEAAYGYRAVAGLDVDGDLRGDIIIGGYADGEAGAQAGGVVRVDLPY